MSSYVPILQEYVRNERFEFEQLTDRAGTLAVLLTRVDGRQIELKFDSYLAYRKLDEGDALLTLSAMGKSGDTSKCLYRVEQSEFLTWFNVERCGQSPGKPLVHYSLAPANDIIDVLAYDLPIVTEI
ncbi:MAG: hypothetical protein KKC79_04770 [Gammaproteobacteria bacterium]|nr:hypothetical protein [Gammaproteobacteria bacterium]MBU1440346.1 hypothetical protein [Gammaproteobacteria bacterium]MBU2287217.1 hypothetical protein [Gammaproteobacteria bacterium]MBU2407947.1 hypothetical protein [Gammaproteobacteria bacterium]